MAGRTSVASSAATRRPPPTPPHPPPPHHHHRRRRRRRLKDGRALGDTALSAGLATTSRRVCSAHILLRLLIVSGYMHT